MKYICIGQPKTGTKTMAKIFNLLNFKVNGNPLCLNDNDDFIMLDNNISYYSNDSIIKCHNNIETFEAFHDYPYSFNYEYINNNFPDSKFILTIRDTDTWFNSLYNYQYIPGAVNRNLLKKLYGYNIISLENKTDIISKYNEYNTNIIKYFDDKPCKLIILDLTKDNIKNKLSYFLKINIDFEIPHENKQTYGIGI
jgi:hypothetical protein